MAKGKKPQAQAGAQPAGQASGCNVLSLPPRPERKGKAPGVPVDLISNLFKISLKSEKPIYCHTLQIDSLAGAPAQSSSGDKKEPKKPAVPRKIPKDMRLQAVKRAVEEWLKNNSQKLDAVTYKYVLDGNASTMYAMFPMLPEHDGTPGTRKSLEVKSSAPSNYIENQKVVVKDEPMLVKFFSPSLIDVRSLIDFCTGKKPCSSALVAATLKTINTIMTPRFVEDPEYLCMHHKTGMASVFPYNKQNQFPINKGIICNKGFTTSARPSEAGPVIMISNTCAPFFEPLTFLQILKERYQVSDFSKPLPKFVIEELKREFKTKQVEATHINYGDNKRPHYRKYRVHDIGATTTEEKFELKDDGTGQTRLISVFEYFKKEYPKCPLKYPNLPCILDNKRKIPLEICQLVDKQKVNRKMEPEETSNVIRQMAVKPEIHFRTIQNNAKDVIEKSRTPLKDFGLEMDIKPIEVTGRELPPITLLADNRKPVRTQGGGYNVMSLKFVKPASQNRQPLKWALVILLDQPPRGFNSLEQFTNECANFGPMYSRAGQMKGVMVAPMGQPMIIQLWGNNGKMPDPALKTKLRQGFEHYNRNQIDHVIFVLPSSRDWLYSYLQYLEVDVPRKIKSTGNCTRASCIKMSNFVPKIIRGDQRNAGMFLSNLWLKYNTKLGGVNIALDSAQNFGIDPKDRTTNFLGPDFLFVSIDVCHPAPGDRLEQSVAAAVAMWNITNPNMSHCTRIRVQRKDKSDKEKQTVEQVGEIGLMFGEILEAYRAKTGGKVPANIVILRDGVSEGQFEMVLRYELGQVLQTIKNFYGKYKVNSPKLTCLTVQKRHKVRFMRKNPVKTHKGDDFNIQPGTVIDNKVVQPNDFSFYCAPHKAIQGTSRAPHIYIIYDEIKFSQDEAQAMIFALSYLSPRCTKGTSIPTPVNLADLAAERGKNIVVSWNLENQTRKLSSDERLVELNAFLSNMGDTQYHNTLYYV